jgi:hypothetical protein
MDDWRFSLEIAVVKEMVAHLAQTREELAIEVLRTSSRGCFTLADHLDSAHNSAANPNIIIRKVVPLRSTPQATCATPVLPPPRCPPKAPLPLPYSVLWLLTHSKLQNVICKRDILPEDTYSINEKGFAMGRYDTCNLLT